MDYTVATRTTPADLPASRRGCSSGVEHNLAKVGVEGSNPFTRSIFQDVKRADNWLESLIFFQFVTRPSPLLSLRAVKKYFFSGQDVQ